MRYSRVVRKNILYLIYFLLFIHYCLHLLKSIYEGEPRDNCQLVGVVGITYYNINLQKSYEPWHSKKLYILS